MIPAIPHMDKYLQQRAHQIDHAAGPLRSSQRLHRHQVTAFPSGPQELGQEQREIGKLWQNFLDAEQ